MGYRLELVSPPVHRSPPLASGTCRTNLVEEEIWKLLEKGAIRALHHCSGKFLSHIFLVPKKDGSFQPVVNLRPLNQFMEKSHFKMESLGMIRDQRLDGLHRPERCTLVGGNLGKSSEIPPLPVAEESAVPFTWLPVSSLSC